MSTAQIPPAGTQQEQTEAELRWKTALLEAQLDSSLDGILVVDSQKRKLLQNQRCIDLWKIPPEIVSSDDASQVRFVMSRTKKPEKFIEKVTYLYEHPYEISRDEIELVDGTVLDRYTSPVLGKDGRHYGRIWMFRDITQRRRTEDELREKTAFLEAQVDSSIDGILVIDNQGRRILQNQRCRDLFKVPPEIIADEDDTKQLQFVRSRTKNPDAFLAKVLYLYTHPNETSQDEVEFTDGTILDRYSAPVLGKEGRNYGRIWTFRDITERKKLEAQLLRAQRMESIGTLAGGIAHDLNNVLTPVLISIELLKQETLGNLHAQQLLDTVEASTRRGADLVQQVLGFARGVDGQRVAVNLGHLAKDLASVTGETFPRAIRIVTDMPRDLWLVSGDPTQLHQVLLNLAINARDAMPEGGILTFRAKNLVVNEQTDAVSPARPGSYVLVEVIDTGMGIPPEIHDRIFEPFFTTKALGHGSGLGLATVHAIVKSHGGVVNLTSAVGRGTTFKVYLPADPKLAAHTSEAGPKPKLPRGQGELILVVDDEEAIRSVVQKTLESFGYQVVTARNGAEALAIFAQQQDNIALVLTDMMMPVMDGPATISALLRLKPDLRIIAASGLNISENIAKAVRGGVRDFLPKPYATEAILQLVRAVLDRHSGGQNP